jgi:hypothetical protein
LTAALVVWILSPPIGAVDADAAAQTSLSKRVEERARTLAAPFDDALREFYAARGGSPAWIREEGAFLGAAARRPAKQLIEALMIDLGPERRAEMGEAGIVRARGQYATAALQTATLAVYERVLREANERRAAKGEGQPVL